MPEPRTIAEDRWITEMDRRDTPTSPKGRVLVVDDEPALLRSYGRILSKLFDVVLVGSGREAVELIQRDRNFDVVVCDLAMPEVSGADVYSAIQRHAPELVERIVFCTGGAYTAELRKFISCIDNPRLEKPIGVQELRFSIAQIRDGKPLS